MVMVTVEYDGTRRTVLCTHLPSLLRARYETQSVCGGWPNDATVCSVRCTRGFDPVAAMTGGVTIRYETM